MDGDELAYELINQYYKYNVIDTRSKEEFEQFHIPTAINIPLNELSETRFRSYLTQREKVNVFYSDNIDDAKRAYLTSGYYGKANNIALTTTAKEFQNNYFNINTQTDELSKKEQDIFSFRTDAATKLTEINEALLKMDKPVEKKEVRVQGGCS